MAGIKDRNVSRTRRHDRVRRKVDGNSERPRLSIFKSARHMYAQIINDAEQKTIAGTSTVSKALKEKCESLNGIDAAKEVGKAIAELAQKHNVKKVVFDRGGFPYKGRVRALADSAREAGLDF